MIKSLPGSVACVAVSVAVGVLIGMWISDRPAAPIGVAVEAKSDPALRGASTETIPCAPVKVYKAPTKTTLGLPAEVQDDPTKQVTTSIRLSADLYPHRITSVFESDTGETKTYDQRLELPWLAVNTSGEAGLIYGYRRGERVLRFEARQALVNIKALKIGAVASFDQSLSGGPGDPFIGLGIAYRW